MKRFFAFLLLVLVSAAAITPCCVYDDCATEASSAQQEEQETEADCSPFFACSGCAGFVETTKPIQVEGLLLLPAMHYEQVYKHQAQCVYSSFWQPPRLA
ncbi:MAG TPA: hypothetical protein VEB40_01380 [Flavipsychrobacter sp.]|nr:hypothetical protein [Flavipsychrobacter sp.]